MDNLRGMHGALTALSEDVWDDDIDRDLPPIAIGQDERRMQVRAYNHWASLLGERNYPAIDDLEPDALPDFGPYSVLLDFSRGIENPGVVYLGALLARECDAEDHAIETLADVPSRSLLSRITDHYMQIIANQAPIGFEAEFVNQHDATILYRGILLPFSSDDDTIDFIYGVINWKELADVQAADELLLEIEQALEAEPLPAPRLDLAAPLTDWADGPGASEAPGAEPLPTLGADFGNALPRPSFGLTAPEPAAAASDDDAEEELDWCFALPRPATPAAAAAEYDAPLPEPVSAELALHLAEARQLADAARSSEDRTRAALYEAIGRAYDFSLAAAEAPAEFERLLADAGLTAQDRAPMTPVVKLVFGADYDKTRLTEYAAALSLAHRLEFHPGELAEHLAAVDGGLKAVVTAERDWRREQAGKPARAAAGGPRPGIARKLRALPVRGFADIAAEGSEFALVMIRRTREGIPVVLGEVPDDTALVERAARRLIG
ncbi:MAG: hypothetical protein B7Z33_01680 [Sphingomonadales bacterium 12-68-11]|nr:MAG: hypothetical protein B7Z33_01680 [Sphingomonadales bacterium 12-68-11]